MNLHEITDNLKKELDRLQFSLPVAHIYNPLEYARKPYDLYLGKYGQKPKEVLLVGMNPGPWGMAQTGVPFGEISAVKNWLRIESPIGKPEDIHPKRPVDGFHCKRSEVSGKRFWGWAKKTFNQPDRFFARFFVANYCPLLFIDADGRNRTPNHIQQRERKPLLSICDRALYETVCHLQPQYVIGIGAFATDRLKAALAGMDITIGRITHPSPANPKANRGWEKQIQDELIALNIQT